MKQILIIFTMILSINTYSQCVEPGCWSNGSHSFFGTSLPNGTAQIYTVNNNGVPDGLYSGTLQVTGNSLTFSVPQPVQNQPVRVKIIWSNGDCTVICSTNQACCITALKFKILKAERLNASEVKVYFEVYDGTAGDIYRVKLSYDGKNFVEKAILSPGTGTNSVIIKL